MGDCRLRIVVDPSLLPESSSLQSNRISRLLASDNTIQTSFQEIKIADCSIWDLLIQKDAAIWDCTVHPVKNITNQCTSEASKTTTLFTAGWFPSGTLQILPASAVEGPKLSTQIHEDQQYNLADETIENKLAVKLVGQESSDASNLPLPSQVLHSVKERFSSEVLSSSEAVASRLANKKQKRQRELERTQKLDAKIQALNSKTSKTSQQVQFMLIKSRAKGRKDLHQDDRIYLHCVSENDSTDEYRFFSRQDTVGRALYTFSPTPEQTTSTVELLVKKNDEFQRLPSTMRFYEAIEAGYLANKPIPTVVIRFYDASSDEPTTTVLEQKDDDNDDGNQATTNLNDNGILFDMDTSIPSEEAPATTKYESKTTSTSSRYEYLARLLAEEPSINQASRKKMSKSMLKVRQMKIKGKATGDAKRVKTDNRFYVELYTVSSDPNPVLTTIGPKFVARSDPVHRLVKDASGGSLQGDWEVVAACFNAFGEVEIRSNSVANSGDDSSNVTWAEAEQQGVVECFDKLVIIPHN